MEPGDIKPVRGCGGVSFLNDSVVVTLPAEADRDVAEDLDEPLLDEPRTEERGEAGGVGFLGEFLPDVCGRPVTPPACAKGQNCFQ